MKLKTLTGVAAAAALLLVLSACAEPGSAGGGGTDPDATGDGPYNLELSTDLSFDDGTTMARIAEAGSMTIGTKFDQPLFGLLGTGDVPSGFDVAIGALVASKMGVSFDSIEFIEAPSNIRETVIQNGEADIVVATYTINDARKELIEFAGPYFLAGQAIMVLEGNDDITGPEDLAGQPVCSVEGSTPAAHIVDEYGAELLATDVYSNCLDPLRNGQVVAVTTDNVILSGFVDQNEGEFQLVDGGATFTDETYGVGLAKDDQAFLDFVNEVLEDAFADGTWERLFGETAGAVLDTPTPPSIDRY